LLEGVQIFINQVSKQLDKNNENCCTPKNQFLIRSKVYPFYCEKNLELMIKLLDFFVLRNFRT